MSSDCVIRYKRLQRFTEAVLLAVVLSASLAASGLLANTISSNAPGAQATGLPDFVIITPLALAAAWIGLSLASWMDLAGRGWAAALNRAALVSLSFTGAIAAFGVSRALMAAATSLRCCSRPRGCSAGGDHGHVHVHLGCLRWSMPWRRCRWWASKN